MLDTHVYEVVGTVLFRRSGNGSRHIEECKIIRTRVAGIWESESPGIWRVNISVLVSGYDGLHLSRWFSDWTNDDLMSLPDMQSGRPVDVAVPVRTYEAVLRDGRPPAFARTPRELSDKSAARFEPFHPLVAAVLIDGRWEEPVR